jgi:hypothetical protein
MKCPILLCAEIVLLDYSTRKISAINILQDSSVPMFPTITPMAAYILLEKDLNEKVTDVYIEIKLNDTVLAKNKLDLNFSSSLTFGSIMGMGVLSINSEGIFSVSIINNDVSLNRFTAKFTKVDKPLAYQGAIPSLLPQ